MTKESLLEPSSVALARFSTEHRTIVVASDKNVWFQPCLDEGILSMLMSFAQQLVTVARAKAHTAYFYRFPKLIE